MCIEEVFGESINILENDLHNIMSDVHTILTLMINQIDKKKLKTTEPEESNNLGTEQINKGASKAS